MWSVVERSSSSLTYLLRSLILDLIMALAIGAMPSFRVRHKANSADYWLAYEALGNHIVKSRNFKTKLPLIAYVENKAFELDDTVRVFHQFVRLSNHPV